MPGPIRKIGISFALCALAAQGQHFPFDVIPGSSGTIEAIAQDREGFLWLAGSKLQRFDGSRLVTIPIDGFIHDFAASPDGAVWIATRSGVYRIENLKAERKLAVDASQLVIQRDLLYYLERSQGSEDRGIHRIAIQDIGKIAPQRLASGFGKLRMDDGGNLWFPCETTVCQLQQAGSPAPKLVRIEEVKGLPVERWRDVAITKKGDIWAVGANRAFVHRAGSSRFQPCDPRLDNVFRLYTTQNKNRQDVWLLGASGVYRERGDGSKPEFFRHPVLPLDMAGFGVFVDREENIWLSRSKGGLARWIGGGSVESWSAQSGLPQAIQITEAADGSIFAGSQQGLFRLKRSQTQWIQIPGTRELGAILQVKRGQPGHVLFATGTLKTYEFDLKTEQWSPAQIREVPTGMPARDIALMPGPGAAVGPKTNGYWPGIELGYPHKMDMIEGKTDSQGRSWFVTRSGLWLRSMQAQWRQFTKADGMLESSVQAIQLAVDDSIWIGYDNPLGYSHLKFTSDQKPQWTHYPSQTQTPAESTLSLGFDTKGRLWRGTGSGVVVTNGASNEGVRLTERDGLPSAETNLLGFFRAKDDSIWISTGEGAAHFLNPAEEPAEGKPVTAAIASIDDTKAELAVLSYSEAHKARLEYRLGASNWILAEPNNAINLSTLRPGDYRLEVRARQTLWFRPANTAIREFTVPGVRPWQWIAGGTLALTGFAGLVLYRKRRAQGAYERHKQQFLDEALAVEPGATPAEAGQFLAQGTVLRDKYRIEELLARGGFSDVYLASVLYTGERVAIKRLRGPANAEAVDPSWMRRRLAQEVAAVCMIKHRGVLPVIDSWMEDDGNPSLVLPFVEGPTLRKLLVERSRLDEATAIAILREVAAIVCAAHAKGVVHCDLKPENVMLSGPELRPIVIDFGTSALHLQAAALSEYTRPAGTVQYMAPEQLLGRYSPATDVYAFALLALELIAGIRYIDLQVPFDAGWEEHLISALTRNGNMPAAAAKLFTRALQFDPLKREQDLNVWSSQLFAMYQNGDDRL